MPCSSVMGEMGESSPETRCGGSCAPGALPDASHSATSASGGRDRVAPSGNNDTMIAHNGSVDVGHAEGVT